MAQFVDSQHLLKNGVAAAIIGTHRKCHAKAAEFWKKVADGIGFSSKSDPAYRLREHLLDGIAHGGHHRNLQRNTYALSIAWWNSWITGEKRSSVKLAAMDRLPKILTGPVEVKALTNGVHRRGVSVRA